ncbi:MAG TPA: hypothetical protein VK196_08130 [Magnetospirillum sp.]|nr:hypothetical protein [Magnetospirillum sp.]
MRTGAVLAAVMMLAATGASAQGPRALTEWMLPGSGAAAAVGVVGDDGLAVAGRGPQGPRLVHVDGRGRIVEDWTMPGSDAWPRAVATPPGALAMVAGPAEPPGHEHGIAVWRMQTGADGRLKQDWLRRFRRTALDTGSGAVALDDGGMVVVGRTGQDGAWVLRLDAEGEPAWRRLASPIAADGLFEARAVGLGADGDVVVAAYGAPSAVEPGGIWLLRFDGAGTDRAQIVIDETDDEHPEALATLADGGVAVAGWILPVAEGVRAPVTQPQAWMVRLDPQGHIAWDHRWPGGAGRISAVTALADGGVLVAGQVAGAALLSRLDRDGKTVWEWRRQNAALHGLTLAADGQAAAAGERHGRMWLVRFGY